MLHTVCTEGIRTQNELSSYLYAASFASLNDVFGYIKKRFCEDSFVLSSKCSSAGEAKVNPPLVTSPLVRIIHLDNSVRVIQLLHLSGQMAALFTRDGSGEPCHVL